MQRDLCICYATQNIGYIEPKLDKIIVSVHVVFNGVIPDPTMDYFAELDKLKIKVALEPKDPADFNVLSGTQH